MPSPPRPLAEHESVDLTLGKIVHLVVEHLENCDHAGISLVERRKFTSPASTGDLPTTVGRIQQVVGEGPCLDAIKERELSLTDDLSAEERWPEFSTRAHEATGVSSILSLHLTVEEDTLGALNLYSTKPGAFDETDIALASVFAAHAAVAVQSARGQHHLEHRARSRELVGNAKGY
ncbi:MAG: GAF domain-containing protein [Acidimicrobiales bacterium]